MTDEVPPRDEPINTGIPASIPPGTPWTGDFTDRAPGEAWPPPGGGPQWTDPDPAAVSGPPWPVLVARGRYAAPPLIRWPIFAGAAVLVAYVVVLIALTS